LSFDGRGLGTRLYLLLLAAAGGGRLVEMQVSRRRLRALRARGVEQAPEPYFRWIVLLHAGVLAGAALEALLLKRRPVRPLAIGAVIAALLANGLRWWVIRSLGQHWNVHVVDSLGLGVVTSGPYRWLRHPNYLALIVELEALPLIHSAWLTALIGGVAHALLLRRRIATEEALLLQSAEYRALMAPRPRLLPRLRWS
jgi:methyltransferase